jgi:hypothetical protein
MSANLSLTDFLVITCSTSVMFSLSSYIRYSAVAGKTCSAGKVGGENLPSHPDETKSAVRQPKGESDPECDLPCSRSSRVDGEVPPDTGQHLPEAQVLPQVGEFLKAGDRAPTSKAIAVNPYPTAWWTDETYHDIPEEDVATNDDTVRAEFNQEMSRGQVSPRDKDLQHVPDDREGGGHAQLPVGEGHASIPEGATAQFVLDTHSDISGCEKGVAPAHKQSEAQPDKTPAAEHEVQEAVDVRDDEPPTEGGPQAPGQGDAPLNNGGGDQAVGNDGSAIFLDEGEDPELRKSLKSGQAKLTQIGRFFLTTGMNTMFLLMTIITMTPLLEKFNMKVISHTGGLDNILRYEINFLNGGDVYRPMGDEDYIWVPVDDSGGNDAKYIPVNPTVTSPAAASVPKEYSCAAMDTGLHRKQIRQEMFDPPDLKGGGAITLDDWLESYSEHMATETIIMNDFNTLIHAATEQFKKSRLNQSKKDYRGEDGMQVNEWLTMGNRRYVRQLDPVLTDDTRPEPVRRIAV